MATTTIVQTQTIAAGKSGWTVPLNFAQFDPTFGTLLDVRIGIAGDVAGSASIENLGATPASVQLQLTGNFAVTGLGGALVVGTQTYAYSTVYLGSYDGTADFAGGSGAVVSHIAGAATGTQTYAPGGAGLASFVGTGAIALTASGSISSAETGAGNLLSLTNAQAGATVTVQYDYLSPSGGGGGGGPGAGSVTTNVYGPVFPFIGPNETFTPTQTLTVSDVATGWNTTLAAAQFDPTLGTLEAVSLVLTGDIDSGFAAENLGSVATFVGMTDMAYVALTLPSGSPITTNPSVQSGLTLGAYDGNTDFAGTSGSNATGRSANQTASQWIDNSGTGNLASFIGKGTIALPLSAYAASSTTSSSSSDLETRLTTLAGATVAISYLYIPATPTATASPPVIAGTAPGQTVTDRSTIAPFAKVTIADANTGATQTVTVTLSAAANGKLSNIGGGSYNATTGVYTASGATAAIIADLEGLIFTPTKGQVSAGLTATTVFTLQDTDSAGGSVSDSSTSVFATAIVVPPTIAGTVGGQRLTAPGSIVPFSGVVIGDTNINQLETLTVTVGSAANGLLSNLGGGTYDAKAGVYSDTGSTAAVTADLQGLVFTPTAFAISPGTVGTSFAISVTDSAGAIATDGAASVLTGTNPASNILFQHDNGQLAIWQVGGAVVNAGSLIGGIPGPSWFAMGTGAFYAGDSADIVWQNQNGAVGLWQVQGTSVLGMAMVASDPGPTWHIRGTGDFYRDGNTDILWQNDNGSVALWDMTGSAIARSGLVGSNPGPTWHIVGTGDFYRDGNTDILWQNDNGSVGIWEVTGTTIVQAAMIASDPGPTWHVRGTGDFYGDGNTDILWQNANGLVAIWDVRGVAIVQSGLVASNPGPTWHIVGTGDFNNDGKTDIVWQSDNGSVGVWDMSGNTIAASAVLANPGTAWHTLGGSDTMRFIYGTAANETLVATPTTPDEFIFTNAAAGTHTIAGFNPVMDSIALSASHFPDFTAVQNAIAAIPGGSRIDLGNGGSLILTGVGQTSLHASNFLLG